MVILIPSYEINIYIYIIYIQQINFMLIMAIIGRKLFFTATVE